MPLLNNALFQPKKVNGISAGQKVFYISLTKEIFLDYDEFFERSILCNSLVWGCSVTGKTGLTYYDAVKSEQGALKNIEVLPSYLHAPILILTKLANCSRIAELAGLISLFFKNRYVMGEKVQISCEGVKTTGVVVDIKCPAVEAYQRLDCTAAVPMPPPEEMRYVIKCATSLKFEKAGKKKNGISPIKVSSSGVFNAYALARYGQKNGSQEIINKVKLASFLRVCCKAVNKRVVVTDEFIQRLSLDRLGYQNFFGPIPLPDFTLNTEEIAERNQVLMRANLFLAGSSKTPQAYDSKGAERKRLMHTESEGQPKKKKAKTCAAINGSVTAKVENKEDMEIMDTKPRKSELDEKLEELRKQKEREEKRLKMEWMKKWSKIRDDLELEDHKEITPMPTAMSQHLGLTTFTGDAIFPGIVSVLDFINTFGEMLKVDKYLAQNKLTFADIMEALHDSNVSGKLFLILSCLVTNVLTCLDELISFDLTVEEQSEIVSEISNWDCVSHENQNALLKASETVFFCLSHLGLPLTRLPVNPYTMSEVLRLLFSASGFKSITEIMKLKASRWNTFDVREDPMVDFKSCHSRILNRLEYKSVYRLNIEEKVKILNCLCDELLSIKPELKERVSNSAELIAETRNEIKKFQKNEAKWKRDLMTARVWRQQMMNSEAVKSSDKSDPNDVMSVLQHLMKMDADSLEQHKRSLIDLIISLDVDDFLDNGPAILEHLEAHQILEIEAIFSKDSTHGDEIFASEDERRDFYRTVDFIVEQINARSDAEENKWIRLMFEYQTTWGITPVGQDRVHRRYWKFRSIPGIFVEEDPEFRKWAELNGFKGHYKPPCLEEKPNWEIEEMAEQGFNGEPMFPKWPQLNSIPSGKDLKSTWSFYSTQSAIDNLIASLNARGMRELSLKENLISIKKYLFQELHKLESQEVFEMLTEYDPNEMNNQCANLDLVEIFCKTCKIFFERLANGPFLNQSLTNQDRQQIFSQINRGFIRDSNASVSGATSVQSYAEILCKLTSAIRKDYLSAPLVSKYNDDQFLVVEASIADDNSQSDGEGMDSNVVIETRPFIERWMTALQSSSGFAQLFLYLQVLNMSIKWSKSAGNVSANFGIKKICSSCFVNSTGMNDHLQMCKVCNVAYHKNEYCFGLKHGTICGNCHRYKSKLSCRNLKHEPHNNNTMSRNGRSIGKTGSESTAPNEDSRPEKEDIFAVLPVLDDGVFCALCGLGGFVLCCETCDKMFHLKCADPPLKDVPKNDWFCQLCTKKVTHPEFELTKRSRQRNRIQDLMQ